MIPWCLFSSGGGGGGSRGTIKLIRPDGLVKIYDRPIHVSELTTAFPKHSVCRSDSFYIGQKTPTLSQQDHLQPGHSYFLLPTHFFQSALSFVTIASFAGAANNSQTPPKTAFLKKAASCQPFQIQKTPSGSVRIRVTEEFLSQLIEQGRMKEEEEEEGDEKLEKDESYGSCSSSSRVCNTPELQKEYSQLVGYSRQCCWKPKLETIRESSAKKMKRLGSFGIKMGSIRKNPQG